MKKIVFLLLVTIAQSIFAQDVILNKVEKISENSDKIFYKINPQKVTAEYLGELEVQGFTDDDPKMFGMVYRKAKEIGANAFSFKPFESIAGEGAKLDPYHYLLNLYYVAPHNFPTEDNVVYLISSAVKKQTIAIDNKNIVFEPRTYKKLTLQKGIVTSISTRKLLGASIKVTAQDNQPVQFFQLSAFSVNENPYGTAGINIKSGDIIRLEQSYGQFLSTIYQPMD